MSEALTGWTLELRRGIGKWLLIPLIALGVFAAEYEVPAGPAVWPLIVSALGVSVELMGPVAAGAAAFAGSRSRRRQTDTMEQLASRSPLAPPLAELCALLAWVLLAFAVVVAVLFIPAAFEATWSSPDAPRTLAAGVGLLLEATVGFVFGRLIPRRFTPLVVAVAMYGVVAYNSSVRSGFQWSLLLPVNLQQYDQFNRLNHAVAVGQLLWYVGLAAGAVAAWGLTRQRGKAVTSVLIGAVALAAAGAGVLVAQHGNSNRSGVAVEWTCAGSSPQLCIHPSLNSARGKIAREFDPIANRLRGTSFRLQRLEQRPRGVGGIPTPGAVAFALDDTSNQAISLAGQELAVNALGFGDGCFTEAGPKPGYFLAQLVGSWVAGDSSLFVPGTPAEQAAQSWFNHLSDTQKEAWLTHHDQVLRSCALSPADFR